MELLSKVSEVREYIKAWKKEGFSVGFVPTMGYLHEGHKSLIEKAAQENDKVVVSIFVNPTQFGPNEDLSTYPRDIERDKKLCMEGGTSLIFNPEPSEMYLEGAATYVNVDNLTEGLCGAKRPGHFSGVCTVVSKLFNIVSPDKAYFGEKDAQQLAVIKRMVRDLNFDVQIVGCPIIREEDGLAKSSRNKYLSGEERMAAVVLSESLNRAKKLLNEGVREADIIKSAIVEEISSEISARIDYVEVVDSLSLETVEKIEKAILVAIAVFIGKTRLIDNFTFEVGEN